MEPDGPPSHCVISSNHKDNEDIVVELESDALNSLQLARRSLVGKVMSEKPLNKGAVKSILIKAWNLSIEVHATDMGSNLFLFTFMHKKDAKDVLDRGPWVKVLIDIKKTPSSGCWVPRKGVPKSWIPFRYEKLQGLCFNCGILGHEQKDCKEEKAMESFNSSIPKFGPKLGVPPAKPVITIMKEQGWWKKTTSSSMEENAGGQREKGENSKCQESQPADNSTDNPDKEIYLTEQEQSGPREFSPEVPPPNQRTS
ncbi:Zinc finger, CCHC-type [Sesbania bispinosa]|nr:Zinc finger, CCHC-type [Sesbania bispinosa]